MGDLSYDEYLHLTPLLSLQQTQAGSERTKIAVSEHFFIVIHQSTELWFKQLQMDLQLVIECLDDTHDPASVHQAAGLLGRATAIFKLLTEHLELLSRHLSRDDFSVIRSTFGSASGLQSSQFRDLSRLLGIRVAGDGALLSAFRTRVARDGLDPDTLFATSHVARTAHHDVADSLLHLGNAYYQWLVGHITLVSSMIGIERGTGGTSGVEFLLRRCELPFPSLREAVIAPQ